MLVVTMLRLTLVTLDFDNVLSYGRHGVIGTSALLWHFLITGNQRAIVV